MRISFRDKLMNESKGTPYSQAFANIILLDKLIGESLTADYAFVVKRFSDYSDSDIALMGLQEVKDESQLRRAIANVKEFLSDNLGAMSSSDGSIYGSNEVYGEYLEFLRAGFEAWSDVIADCEEFMDSI